MQGICEKCRQAVYVFTPWDAAEDERSRLLDEGMDEHRTVCAPPADRLHTLANVSFAGVGTAQVWADFYLWEQLLNAAPETKAVLELGTDRGGFSLYLQAQCDYRGIAFHTFDVVVPEAVEKLRNFHKKHVFLEHEFVASLMNSFEGPIILFCDNGNKPRELEMFSDKMPPGSVVAVHDWGTETLPSDVPDWLDEVMGGFCDEIGSITRVFKPKDKS